MNASDTSRQSASIAGILSMFLSPLGLLLVVYFASGAGSGVTPPRAVIIFAQYSLLALLGSGLASGMVGVARREEPIWLSRMGLILTLVITSIIAFYFYSLDD